MPVYDFGSVLDVAGLQESARKSIWTGDEELFVLRCITSYYVGPKNMSITSIRIAAALEQPLQELSNKLDRSKSYLINQAIKEYLAKQALADSRWQDTLLALDSIKAGKSIDEAEVNAWLDTWGSSERKPPPVA